MGRLLKIWQRGLGFAFITIFFAGLLTTLLPQSANADARRWHFNDAGSWVLEDIEFNVGDTGDDFSLKRDLVSQVGGGDLAQGIITLNDYVDQLLQNGTAVWKDGNVFDSNQTWTLTGCKNSSMFYDSDSRQYQIEELFVNIPGPGCKNFLKKSIQIFGDTIPLPPAERTKLETRFEWVDAGTIRRVDGREGNFVETNKTSRPGTYFRVQQSEDQDHVVVPATNKAGGTYIKDGQPNGTHGIGKIENSTIVPTDEDGDNVPDSAKSPTLQEANCEGSEASGFGWIGCMLIRAVDNVLGTIESQVESIMEINIALINTDNQIKEAWDAMRNIASILLVLFALIMVLSTAVGIGPFDAYTIKKVLPRMVVAVILMQVSWSLMLLLIEITNEVGGGIKSIMLEPFGGEAVTNLGSVLARSGDGSQVGWFNAAASGTIFGGGILLGIMGILSLAFTTFVGVMIGFLVLVLRNIVIVAALIFAPIALVCYILPNTEKVGKLWWDAFSKGLMMYPLIIILLTSGKIFSHISAGDVAADGHEFGNVLQFLIVVVAYAVPYFLIPATFKLAGGAIATLGGMANDRSRGFFDRAKKKRGERIHENIAKSKAGKRWDENTGPKIFGKTIGKRFNKLADFAVEPGKYSAYHLGKEDGLASKLGFQKGIPGMRKFSAHVGASVRNSGVEQTAKVLEKLNSTGMFNDKAYRAIAGAFGEWNTKGLEALAVPEADRTDNQKRAIAVRQGLLDSGFMDKEGHTLKQAHALKDFTDLAGIMDKGGETERIAANALRNEAGYLATVHEDAEMSYASIAGAGLMGLASHGFASGKDLSDVGNYMAHHKGGEGRDMAHALVTRAQVLGQGQRPDIKAGYGVLVDPNTGDFVDGMGFDYEYETDASGNKTIKRDAKGQAITTNAQSYQRAAQWLRTVKQQDWMGAKAGAVMKSHDLILEQASETKKNADGTDVMEEVTQQYRAQDGSVQERTVRQAVLTSNAKALRESIALGASAFSSSDVDAKVVWQDIASKIPGLEDRVKSSDQFRAITEAMGKGDGGAGGPTLGGPSIGGP